MQEKDRATVKYNPYSKKSGRAAGSGENRHWTLGLIHELVHHWDYIQNPEEVIKRGELGKDKAVEISETNAVRGENQTRREMITEPTFGTPFKGLVGWSETTHRVRERHSGVKANDGVITNPELPFLVAEEMAPCKCR